MAIALAVVGVLLLAEPDMGAFMVIAAIAMGILFLGGVNGRMFLLITAVLVGAFVLMITLSEWRRERIFAYLNPWDEKYTQGKAYQLTHSLIAFGRGESSARAWAAASRSCTTCPRRTPTSCSP
jgi:cell division protein FtsW